MYIVAGLNHYLLPSNLPLALNAKYIMNEDEDIKEKKHIVNEDEDIKEKMKTLKRKTHCGRTLLYMRDIP